MEHGFHTNREDTALLKDSAYRDKLAKAECKGICDYLGVAYRGAEEEVPWYQEDQKWAVARGITDGSRPTEAATRAEVWAMLRQMEEKW